MIDLHTHSIYSDGTKKPSELLAIDVEPFKTRLVATAAAPIVIIKITNNI